MAPGHLHRRIAQRAPRPALAGLVASYGAQQNKCNKRSLQRSGSWQGHSEHSLTEFVAGGRDEGGPEAQHPARDGVMGRVQDVVFPVLFVVN
jgi:hypothetical protein